MYHNDITLLVDIGNTAIKWAILQNGELQTQQRVIHHSQELTTLLTQYWSSIPTPMQIWIGSVAGESVQHQITQWILQHWQIKPHFVQSTARACGIKNAYIRSSQLGVDRWLSLIAAHHLFTGQLCVVDCGTAVTLDVILENGEHQGGLILAGLTMMQNTLLNNTATLAELTKKQCQHDKINLLARDTKMGIQLGSLYAVIGCIEHIMNTLAQDKQAVKLILTGGDAPHLQSALQYHYQYMPDLVLQGLKIMANQNL